MYYAVKFGASTGEDPHDEGYVLVVDAETEADAEAQARADRHWHNRERYIGTQVLWVVHPTVQWVNAYSVCREYGGPEEGGWWYDWNDCLASMPVASERQATAVMRLMRRNLGWEPEYPNSSVLGTGEFRCWVEDKRAESQSTARPMYC